MQATAEVEMSFVEAVRDALDIAMGLDDDVFLLGEDISDATGGGVFRVTGGLSTKYGLHRVRHTPISEQAIVGAAVGAALVGMRPVAEIMLMNFMAVAMDQVTNHAAKLRYMSGGQTAVPLTIRTTTGAGGGFGAQHSDMLEAWFAHTAGLKVVVPSNPADAKGLLLSCIFDDDPCIVVENSLLYFFAQARQPVPTGDHRVPLGSAAVRREGSEVTVVAYGRQVTEALAAAERLADEGIQLEVIDLRTVAPFDQDTVLASVAKTGRAVIAHEAVRAFGVGAEVASRISEQLHGELRAPVARVGAPSCPVPYAASLEAAYVPTADDIANAARATLAWPRAGSAGPWYGDPAGAGRPTV